MNKPNPSDIPIIYCRACNRAPMIAKTFNQHLREKDGIDIELECPHCGATTIEKLPSQHRSVNPDAASKTDE
jgi:RNase P subunit RPR2